MNLRDPDKKRGFPATRVRESSVESRKRLLSQESVTVDQRRDDKRRIETVKKRKKKEAEKDPIKVVLKTREEFFHTVK